MKRILCLLLLLSILLCGCGKKDDVTFHYRSADELDPKTGSVLGAETRDVTGYRDDAKFLISLYLAGPLDQDLQSAFPAGTTLQSLIIRDDQLTIQLYDLPQALSDSDFSLACACLTMTCMEFTEARSVTILCGDRTVTMNRSVLTFTDTPAATSPTNGGTP